MWTFEQWMRLLSVLAWPAVAVIVCMTALSLFKRVSSLIMLMCTKIDDRVRNESIGWQDAAWRIADRISVVSGGKDEAFEETCERAFLAILAANGGIPASREEKAARALVREIRDMYSEIESPTEAPPSRTGTNSLDYYDLNPNLDEEIADHVYAQFATDELDAQEGDDESQ